MTMDDPRLTAFAIDALPTGERIQVQRALSENPSLGSELDAIEEFSSRLERAFRKSCQPSLDEGQWAEILSGAVPQAEAVALPVAAHPDWVKPFSPWILPLVATLVAAAIVFSTMFYKPSSTQPVEVVAGMITKADQEQPFVVNPSAQKPEITTHIAKPLPNQAGAVSSRSTSAITTSPAVLAEQTVSPENSAVDTATFGVAPAVAETTTTLQKPAPASHTTDGLVQEDGMGNEPIPPQPAVLSAIPIGGGGGTGPTPTPDSIAPSSVVEQPALRQTAPASEKKNAFVSNQAGQQQLETSVQAPAPKQAQPKSNRTTTPSQNALLPAQLANDSSPANQSTATPVSVTESPTSQTPAPQANLADLDLDEYEGGSFGELPSELVPGNIEVLDDHYAVVTLSNGTLTTTSFDNVQIRLADGVRELHFFGATANFAAGVSSLHGNGLLTIAGGSTSKIPSVVSAASVNSVNVAVYSPDGIFTHYLTGDLDDLVVLDISPPYVRMIEDGVTR